MESVVVVLTLWPLLCQSWPSCCSRQESDIWVYTEALPWLPQPLCGGLPAGESGDQWHPPTVGDEGPTKVSWHESRNEGFFLNVFESSQLISWQLHVWRRAGSLLPCSNPSLLCIFSSQQVLQRGGFCFCHSEETVCVMGPEVVMLTFSLSMLIIHKIGCTRTIMNLSLSLTCWYVCMWVKSMPL